MMIKVKKVMTIFLILNALDIVSIENDPAFKTDTSKRSIELTKVLSGGPGKDGIPAINNPKYIKVQKADNPDDSFGALVKIKNEFRYYPYNILVWHEIVNDSIDGIHFTVTFCPLCGTAIVFNRMIDGKKHEFGVSGYLYESNLLMYDNVTESLWSQSLGEAVIGEYTGKKLELIDVNLLDFKYVKQNFPDALVLSTDTGYSRNYTLYPYGDYDTNDKLYFPVSRRDSKYHLKELMYVFRYDGISFTFPVNEIKTFKYNYKGTEISIEKNSGEIDIIINGINIPGYYEMWFSWVIHNSDNGIVIEFE